MSAITSTASGECLLACRLSPHICVALASDQDRIVGAKRLWGHAQNSHRCGRGMPSPGQGRRGRGADRGWDDIHQVNHMSGIPPPPLRSPPIATCQAQVSERAIVTASRRLCRDAVAGKLSLPGVSRPRVAFLEWLEPLFFGGHWIPDMVAAAGKAQAGTAASLRPLTSIICWLWAQRTVQVTEASGLRLCGAGACRGRRGVWSVARAVLRAQQRVAASGGPGRHHRGALWLQPGEVCPLLSVGPSAIPSKRDGLLEHQLPPVPLNCSAIGSTCQDLQGH